MIAITNDEPESFYPLLGPFLSRPEVVAAVGGSIWDYDGKTWYVDLGDDGEILGFVGAVPTNRAGTRWSVESLYVLDGDDGRAQRLVSAATAHAGSPAQGIHAVVKHAVAAAYQAVGYIERSRTTRFVKLARP